MKAMGKVAISAAVGIGVAVALMIAAGLGAQLPPALLMTLAAALTVGAATAVLTHHALEQPKRKIPVNEILGKRIRDVKELVSAFPKGGAVQLSIKADTIVEELEVVKNPSGYANKDIVVTLKDGGKGNGPAQVFNPVTLKRLFVALKDQPNFLHVLLVDKHDEFVGYIPSFRAKSEFTGGNAEGQIVRYIIEVFADHAKSVNLHQIDGLSNTDTISDEAKLSEAQTRMEGGFLRLVVLHRGRHRKPVGLLFSEQLLAKTKPTG
jgi:hypothetical protein